MLSKMLEKKVYLHIRYYMASISIALFFCND